MCIMNNVVAGPASRPKKEFLAWTKNCNLSNERAVFNIIVENLGYHKLCVCNLVTTSSSCTCNNGSVHNLLKPRR